MFTTTARVAFLLALSTPVTGAPSAEHTVPELEAARSARPYYGLQWTRGQLVLSLKGVELRRYDTDSIEIGVRASHDTAPRAETALFECVRLDLPERKDVPPPGQEGEALLHQNDTADELPALFRAQCGPELRIRFTRSTLFNIMQWLRDRWPAAGESTNARRLRVTLPLEEFDALYRAMPATFLLLVPPTS